MERPVNGRMYRGSWLLLTLPLLIALLTIAHPSPLPAPALPPTFDKRSAEALAGELSSLHPDRSPGSPGALGATRWVFDQLQSYGYGVRPVTRRQDRFLQTDRFFGAIPGLGRVPLTNVVAAVEPLNRNASDVILVTAHRDDGGTGPGANDNGSGTAALIELARAYASTAASAPASVNPTHWIVFASTDGGVYGGLGATRLARQGVQRFLPSAFVRTHIAAVINLDAIGGPGRPRIEITGDRPRSPALALVETAAARIFDQAGAGPGRTSAVGQLIDLGFPFSLYEQAPFVGRGISAITLTTSGNLPNQSSADTAKHLDDCRLCAARVGQLGRAAQSLLASLDQGLEPARGTSSYLYLGTRFVRGWTIQLCLISLLVPFLSAAVDLFARCRRRGIALRPALRAYRARLLFWLLVGAFFELFALTGVWPQGEARPLDPSSDAASSWPFAGLVGFAALSGLAWLAARKPLVPRRRATGEEELAGHTAALLALGLVALLVVATNPFALVFLLPSLHAWLWLPQVRESGQAVRFGVLLAGLAGPLLLVGSFAVRFGLGLDSPWYLAELVAVGYVGLMPFVLALAWAAAGAQLLALTTGRYTPYPSRRELPRGPVRELVRRTILTILRIRAQRRAAPRDQRALEE